MATTNRKTSVQSTKAEKPAFTCTPEQKAAALKAVARTIELQKIIGPASCGNGYPDILKKIDAEYSDTVARYLESQHRWDSASDGEGPLSSVKVAGKDAGFLLRSSMINKNGSLDEQAKSEDFLFAVSGRQALGYEVKKAGKSKWALSVYYAIDFNDGDAYRYRQVLDLHVGPAWVLKFQCPYCDEPADSLFLTFDSDKFGCVTCVAGIVQEEANRYQRCLKAEAKGGAA